MESRNYPKFSLHHDEGVRLVAAALQLSDLMLCPVCSDPTDTDHDKNVDDYDTVCTALDQLKYLKVNDYTAEVLLSTVARLQLCRSHRRIPQGEETSLSLSAIYLMRWKILIQKAKERRTIDSTAMDVEENEGKTSPDSPPATVPAIEAENSPQSPPESPVSAMNQMTSGRRQRACVCSVNCGEAFEPGRRVRCPECRHSIHIQCFAKLAAARSAYMDEILWSRSGGFDAQEAAQVPCPMCRHTLAEVPRSQDSVNLWKLENGCDQFQPLEEGRRVRQRRE